MANNESDMTVFVAVVGRGSFAGAAKELDLTASAVSRRISKLEQRLGVRLLHRTTRRLSLTEAGETYFRRSTDILEQIEDTERETSQLDATPRGRLRVTALTAFGHASIVELVPKFVKAFPDVSIELTLSDTVVDLVGEGIDVAIRFGELKDASTIARRLLATRHVVTAAPQYLAEHGEPRVPEDLVRHNCLVRHEGARLFNEWTFEDKRGPRTIAVSGNFTADSLECLYRAAIAGLGVLRTTSFVVENSIEKGELVPVLESFYSTDEVPIYAVYASRANLPPKVRAFIDFLGDELR